MRLSEALTIARVAPESQTAPFSGFLGCGYTPLHLRTFLAWAWNIGASSVVFVDDSPIRPAEVKSAQSAVECLLSPKAPAGVYDLIERRYGCPRIGSVANARGCFIESKRKCMDNLEVRLTRCFATLFPDLGQEEIRQASMPSVAAWDSVATVTLINVVEEEFGIQVDLEDVEQLVSFQEFLQYLQGMVPV